MHWNDDSRGMSNFLFNTCFFKLYSLSAFGEYSVITRLSVLSDYTKYFFSKTQFFQKFFEFGKGCKEGDKTFLS